jgi:autotransporter-associated beta strand protein
MILRGANTYTGSTEVNQGNLELANALALQNSPLVTSGAGKVFLGDGITSLTFGGLSGESGDLATIILNYGNVTSLTLNPAAGSVLTYGGVIADGATGMSLTKTGAGTQILSGDNTYTGTTTVSAGTLVVLNPRSSLTATIQSNSFVVDFASIPDDGTYAVLPGPVDEGSFSSATFSATGAVGKTVTWTNSPNLAVVVSTSAPANQKPVITSGQSFAIAENSLAGTSVGTLLATDADNPSSLTGWEITGGNPSNAFAINDATGELTVVGGLDYETNTSYTLTVTVSDGTDTSDPVDVTLNVVNVAEFSDVFGSANPTADDNGDGIPNLMAYALGATTANSVVDRPQLTLTSSKLTLTTLVRINDPKVQVMGYASTDLPIVPSPLNMVPGTPTTDQNGAVSGVTQRQEFTVERGTNARQFLRLKATQAP